MDKMKKKKWPNWKQIHANWFEPIYLVLQCIQLFLLLQHCFSSHSNRIRWGRYEQAMAAIVYVRPYARVRAYTHMPSGIKTGKNISYRTVSDRLRMRITMAFQQLIAIRAQAIEHKNISAILTHMFIIKRTHLHHSPHTNWHKRHIWLFEFLVYNKIFRLSTEKKVHSKFIVIINRQVKTKSSKFVLVAWVVLRIKLWISYFHDDNLVVVKNIVGALEMVFWLAVSQSSSVSMFSSSHTKQNVYRMWNKISYSDRENNENSKNIWLEEIFWRCKMDNCCSNKLMS